MLDSLRQELLQDQLLQVFNPPLAMLPPEALSQHFNLLVLLGALLVWL